MQADSADLIRRAIRSVPDWPKPGVVFRVSTTFALVCATSAANAAVSVALAKAGNQRQYEGNHHQPHENDERRRHEQKALETPIGA